MAETDVNTLGSRAMGAEVRTQDGARLGTVEEVLGDYFRVAGDEGREYWFGLALLESVDGSRAQVRFPEADLGTHSVPAPDRYQESQYNDGEPLSAEEERQRERVLGELVEQREEIRNDPAATEEADDTVGEPVEQELARMTDDDPDAGRTTGPG